MSVNYCSDRPSTAQLEALYSGVGWSLYLAPGLLDACLDGSLWFETAWAPSDAESSSGEEPPEWPDGRLGAGPAVEQEGSGMSPGGGSGAGPVGGRRLVGLVRVVGDGASIAYVQDLLVHPDWQRRGIGARLLRDAMEIQDRYWWDEDQQMPVESYAADFTDPEDYRGINAAMHTVEAYLATADVTGEVRWLERALKITDFAVNVQAREHGWRLPEHYSASWEPRLDYNRDEPAHPFRPYGVTPGHGLEWARLTVQLRGALINRSMSAPEWMLEAAEHIFDQARTDGWRVDGAPGFVYTTDFDGKPVVHERMHWVVCEGISASAAIRQALLDDGRGEIDVEHYEHCYRAWIDYAEEFLIEAPGVWTHELDRDNRPSTRTWAGHPDIYHALQATLMARLPVWPAIGQALAEGRLDEPNSLLPARASKPHRRGFFGRA